MLSRAHDIHPDFQHPQLRHCCAYRPWQIDAGRPSDPDHRGPAGARDEGTSARFHGYRARARHHHQGADRAADLSGQGRQDLHSQSDRHPRPWRLRLRGFALAASQGVEAQAFANVYHALDAGHEIVPVLNKLDLPAAEPDQVKRQIEDVIGIDASDAVMISAKTGLGIDDVLEAIVHRLPPPKGDREAPLKALLVDSWYDVYLGVVVLVRIVDGVMKKGQRIRMMGTGAAYDLERVGFFTPKMHQVEELGPGEIGFITAAIKEVADTRVGDTITDDRKPATDMLPGFKPAIPVVFCGLFPVDADDFETLRAAMGKLRLNDASFSFEMETSAALGFGFRCGFLGLLHLEIIQERLQREFDLNLIATAPSVIYRMHLTDGQTIEIHNPVDMPDVVKIAEMQAPWLEATILTPDE